MKLKKFFLVAIVLSILAVAVSVSVYAVPSENKKPPNEKVSLSIMAANLSFEESVHLLYAVSYEGVAPEDIQMLYWRTPKKHKHEYVKENAEYVSTESEAVTVSGKACRMFENTQLWAKNMTETIYARAYAVVDGKEYYSDVKSYSILEYAYNKLGHTGPSTNNPKLKELIEELLEYGARAQCYFEHNTDSLPTDPHGKIEVEGGQLPDGMDQGLYKTETEITLTAFTDDETKPYVKWTDADGNVVGYGKTLTVVVTDTTASYTAECYALYSLTFLDSDDSVLEAFNDLLIGDSITPASPEKEGDTFLGWSTEKYGNVKYAPDETIVMGDDNTDKFYAVWESELIEGTVGTDGLIYELSDDGSHYTVVGYNGTSTDVLVGNLYNRLPVTAISGAFGNNTKIEHVTVCEGITSIGDISFFGCASLKSIALPTTLESIGFSAFYGCTSLQSITLPFVGSDLNATEAFHFGYIFGAVAEAEQQNYIPASLKTVEILSGKLTSSAFYGCAGIENVILSNVSLIDSAVFTGCDHLQTLTVSTQGELAIENSVFRDLAGLKEVTLGQGVVSLGNHAFYNCTSLETVRLNDGIHTVGQYAFANCKSLVNVNIPASVTAINVYVFSNCTALSEIVIPSTVTSIASNAFQGCTALSEIVIPSTVTSIASNAFQGCTALESITLPFIGGSEADAYPLGYIFGTKENEGTVGVRQYYSASNYATYYIPTSLKKVTLTNGAVTYGAFYGIHSLESVVLGDGVSTLGSHAFYQCEGLTSVKIGNGITKIGDYAFGRCKKLQTVELHDGITTFADHAFYSCESLQKIRIPVKTTVIEAYAFANTKGLTEITLASPSLTSIGTRAFEYAGTLGEGICLTVSRTVKNLPALGVTTITAVYFEEGSQCTVIGNNAFRQCAMLTEIVLPDCVTEIGKDAFQGCTSLTEIVIPQGVTAISEYAFNSCTSLTSITIPEGVTSIGDGVFAACKSLKTIIFQGTTAQWKAISKGANWDLHSAVYTVYCTNGTLSK